MVSPPLQRPSLAPRNWGGWLMAGFMWLLGHLPMALGRALVAPIGPLMYYAMGSRRRIAERNLQACFPEKPEAERQAILKSSFRSLARMLVEMAWCWAGPAKNLGALTDLRGLEHAEAAVATGKGILTITAHMTCLEIGARVAAERYPGCGMYRPLKNEVMEWYQNRGRFHYVEGMISKRDLRGAVRYLRKGGSLWYATDQDFGPRHSVFAPFFGIQTASLVVTQKLPAMTGCVVLAMLPRYVESTGRYEIEFTPMLENFPTEDAEADLARVNAILEEQVRRAPEQYWWIHRRFKTRPEGEPPFYGDQSRRRRSDEAPAPGA